MHWTVYFDNDSNDDDGDVGSVFISVLRLSSSNWGRATMITMMLLPMVVMVVVVVVVMVAVMMIINLQTGVKPRLFHCAACALSCVVIVRFCVCRLFGTTGYCAACNKMIPAFEMVMRARGNVYHLECFACQQCSHRLVSVCIQPHTSLSLIHI